MNFVRLVENGTYSKDKLSKENKAVIDGMDEIIRQVEEYEPQEVDIFDNGSEGLIGKLIKEIQYGTLEELATMLYVTRCEAIVSLMDDEEVEREMNKERGKNE